MKADNGGNTLDNVVRDTKQARPTNEYYAKVARNYGYAKYATIVLLAVFLVYVFVAYGDNLTYDNLMYLIKDFNTESSGNGAVFETIRFEGQQDAQYELYGGELAVIGNSGLSLYSKSGSKTLGYYTAYSEPIMKTSDKYILVYDLGGKDYSLYTNLARVVSRSADHTVMGGDVSDSGAYALVTRSSTSKFKINLYSSSLNLAWTYYKDSYIADIALSDDGKNIVVASYDISGYDFKCEVALCSVKKDEPLKVSTFVGVCPYRVEYLSDGSFSVLCDNCILFFDKNGEQTGKYDYGGKTLSAVSYKNEYTLAAFTDNSVSRNSTVVLLSQKGEAVYSTQLAAEVKDVSIADDYTMYVLTAGEVIRITPEFVSEKREYSAGADRIIALDGYALAISKAQAESVFTAAENSK